MVKLYIQATKSTESKWYKPHSKLKNVPVKEAYLGVRVGGRGIWDYVGGKLPLVVGLALEHNMSKTQA